MKVNNVLKIVNKSPNPFPKYETEGDSGFDIRAWITEKESQEESYVTGKSVIPPVVYLDPFERRLIHTGLYFEIPYGYEVQIRPRSGLALKMGIHVHLGTIDFGYKGEVCVILFNLSDKQVRVESGDRIAQGVLCPVSGEFFTKLISVGEINIDSERGVGGFGHTGKT